jgi:peptidoglycan/LPS O-acetylase OafA/YrhL
MKQPSIRPDIQFLRGIAVLAVLFYHSGVIGLSGGYLGVDVFFVISGYLITTMILRDRAADRFSFFQFYARRAKRLLPAAYCTLIIFTFLSAKILTSAQWHDYIKQFIGAVTFTANIVLPFQTGYFQTDALGKPLLHTWSLSIEEQYYLCIPLILYLVPSRWHFRVLAIVSSASLLICIGFVTFPFSYWRLTALTNYWGLTPLDSQTAAFYLLPTRAWEMLSGSLLAWLVINGFRFKLPNRIKLLGFVLICYLCAFPIDGIHPRTDAILVVFATAMLIAGSSDWLPQNKLTKAIEKIGDWSYSLYLVHWPLFALARDAYLGRIPKSIGILLVFLSIALAGIQYKFVEERFRYGLRTKKFKMVKWLAVASAVVCMALISANLVRSTNRAPNFEYLQLSNIGLHSVCVDGEFFGHSKECQTAENPVYAIWGDSYAMHLIPGLIQDKDIGNSFVQITKSSCAPIIGVALINDGDDEHDEKWAKGCLDYNEKAIKFIQDSSSIKNVIISSPFSGYLDYGKLSFVYNGKRITGDRSIAITEMTSTLKRLAAFGKHVIIIAPPPKAGFNIGECWERKKSQLLVLGRDDCNFQIEEYRVYQRGIIDGLNEVSNRANVDLLRFDEIICKDGYCQTLLPDGTSIYKDNGHLTIAGSEWVVPKLDLARFLANRDP